jgi:Leucine-rich repeat (LRR) protein
MEVFFLLPLERLFLNDNSFSQHSLPPEVGLLSKLKTMRLERSGLTGNLPSQIGMLNNLEALIIHDNDLTGTIPTEIGAASNLKFFDLSQNGFSGQLPSEIGMLIFLENLDASYNNITGQLPRELASITAFQADFDFRENNLNGTIPEEFCVQSCCAQGNIEVDVDEVQPCDWLTSCLPCTGKESSIVEEALSEPDDP